VRTDTIIRVAGEAINTVLLTSAPMLVIALVVGLAVSIFQATTQIQEQTLAFVPKILAVLLSVLFFGPWILAKMVGFTYHLLSNLYLYIG
jgi:flagellar biosynthesis protein FliQ